MAGSRTDDGILRPEQIKGLWCEKIDCQSINQPKYFYGTSIIEEFPTNDWQIGTLNDLLRKVRQTGTND